MAFTSPRVRNSPDKKLAAKDDADFALGASDDEFALLKRLMPHQMR
jgi:hypothetical protein